MKLFGLTFPYNITSLPVKLATFLLLVYFTAVRAIKKGRGFVSEPRPFKRKVTSEYAVIVRNVVRSLALVFAYIVRAAAADHFVPVHYSAADRADMRMGYRQHPGNKWKILALENVRDRD